MAELSGGEGEENSELEDDETKEGEKIAVLGEAWRRNPPMMAELPEQNDAESDSLTDFSEDEEGLDDVRPRFRTFLQNKRKKVTKKSPKIPRKKIIEALPEDGSKIRKRRGNLSVRVDGATVPIRKIKWVTRSRKGLRSQADERIEIENPLESIESGSQLKKQDVDVPRVSEGGREAMLVVPDQIQPQGAVILNDLMNCLPAPNLTQPNAGEIEKGMEANLVEHRLDPDLASLKALNLVHVARNTVTVDLIVDLMIARDDDIESREADVMLGIPAMGISSSVGRKGGLLEQQNANGHVV